MATVAIAPAINVQSVRQFMMDNGFNQVVNTVRVNTSGYPYVTFINAKNVASNIYFSKGAAAKVQAGKFDASFFKGYQIVIAQTEKNGELPKISLKGESNRINLADMDLD